LGDDLLLCLQLGALLFDLFFCEHLHQRFFFLCHLGVLLYHHVHRVILLLIFEGTLLCFKKFILQTFILFLQCLHLLHSALVLSHEALHDDVEQLLVRLLHHRQTLASLLRDRQDQCVKCFTDEGQQGFLVNLSYLGFSQRCVSSQEFIQFTFDEVFDFGRHLNLPLKNTVGFKQGFHARGVLVTCSTLLFYVFAFQ